MKVLQISKFYPPVLGGIESVAWELTEGLNRAGVPTDVLCANHRPVTVWERFSTGYEVCRAASWGMLQSTSMAPALAYQLALQACRHDVVHVHMPDPMAAAAIWLTRPRCRVVVHWHSDVIRQRLALKAYEPLQRWLLDRADAVIATSQAYADASPALQSRVNKVSVIPIGISDNRDQANADRVAAIRRQYRGRNIVFALGRMTYYKGFDVLIEAAKTLPDHCAVLIGGDGELLDDYRRAVARAGLVAKVHLPGQLPDHDLPSYFAACDVFCMPSTKRSEAYGVAMLEAMVMGKPIVASNIGGSGVPWVNVDGETGVNVPVGQPAALAAALTRLVDDETLRESMGTASRQRYVTHFNTQLMTQQTLDLYQGLLGAC